MQRNFGERDMGMDKAKDPGVGPSKLYPGSRYSVERQAIYFPTLDVWIPQHELRGVICRFNTDEMCSQCREKLEKGVAEWIRNQVRG